MPKKVIILVVVLSVINSSIPMIVMFPSSTNGGTSIIMSCLIHCMLGGGTPSATHEREASSGEITVTFSGAVLIVGGTVDVITVSCYMHNYTKFMHGTLMGKLLAVC